MVLGKGKDGLPIILGDRDRASGPQPAPPPAGNEETLPKERPTAATPATPLEKMPAATLSKPSEKTPPGQRPQAQALRPAWSDDAGKPHNDSSKKPSVAQ